MQDLIKIIYRHPDLSQEDLDRLAQAHTPVSFKKGELLLKEGDTAQEYYLLQEGLVRAFVYDYNNTEITTEFFVEQEIVIVPSSLFQQVPSRENLQAVTDCRLLKITFEDFQKLFHDIKGISEWGRYWFSHQLFSMKQRSLEIITETATDRYLKLLKEKPDIIKYAPLKYIASYLGITDSSLSRIRREC